MQDARVDKNQMQAQPHLERRLGLLSATSINMSNMVGAGTFITLPLILSSMGGPQALLGWFTGTLIALADGMVWSELAGAFPGEGGSYVYLRDSFGRRKWGRFLGFMFIFQLILSGPLEIGSSNIGLAQYMGYLWPGMTARDGKWVAAGAGVLATFLLYRKITSIAKVMVTLWAGMLVAVVWVIISGFMHFNARLAFSFPPQAFALRAGNLMGLGSSTLYVMYCYLGYYAVCYLGEEVVDPPRTVPRSIIISVLVVFLINLLLCLSVLGVIPWREAMQSPFIVALFMSRVYGNWAGRAVSLLIVWSAFAGTYALILAYSRVPYAAALDGNFFSPFRKLHTQKDFPHVSLLLIGALSVLSSLFELAEVISALMTARILVQFVMQIAAVVVLRKFRPEVCRPFKMILYPLPCAVALVGWLFLFLDAGIRYVSFGLLTVLAGCAAFAIMSWKRQTWPFGRFADAG